MNQPIIQIIFIALGWVVVHKLTTNRDNRKARIDLLSKEADAITGEILSLFELSLKYHKENRDISNENKIKMSLQDISARASMLTEICTDNQSLSACRSAILRMKRSITAEHFEDEHSAPLDDRSQQINSIAGETLKAKQTFLRFKQRLLLPR